MIFALRDAGVGGDQLLALLVGTVSCAPQYRVRIFLEPQRQQAAFSSARVWRVRNIQGRGQSGYTQLLSVSKSHPKGRNTGWWPALV